MFDYTITCLAYGTLKYLERNLLGITLKWKALVQFYSTEFVKWLLLLRWKSYTTKCTKSLPNVFTIAILHLLSMHVIYFYWVSVYWLLLWERILCKMINILSHNCSVMVSLECVSFGSHGILLEGTSLLKWFSGSFREHVVYNVKVACSKQKTSSI